ncbi:hypothetical protein [Bradyrhizobium sp. CCBAU 65884]|uniref:hypothetical protein n=1 Tax=Bradyrhizobium sp. CCBAU 65884 TaxID=722477 RepID=UPI002306D1C0|nr:hypothetical protein [Bradyrhizobium sp. CCBAU 65884]
MQMTLPGPEAQVLATKIQIQGAPTEKPWSEAAVEGALLRQEESPERKPNAPDETSVLHFILLPFRGIGPVSTLATLTPKTTS